MVKKGYLYAEIGIVSVRQLESGVVSRTRVRHLICERAVAIVGYPQSPRTQKRHDSKKFARKFFK